LPPLRRTANAHGRETGGVVLDVEGRSEKEGGGEREQDQEQECLMARRVQSFLLLSLSPAGLCYALYWSVLHSAPARDLAKLVNE
jgi:hypothetical protein